MHQHRRASDADSLSLSQDDDKEARLLPKQSHDIEESNHQFRDRQNSPSPWIQQPILRWMISLSLLCVYTIIIYLYLPRKQSDSACGKQVSMWSPLNDAIRYEEVKIINAFAQQSKYRGPPSPDLERAWEYLWYFDPTPFPANKLGLVNQSTVGQYGRPLLPAEEGEHGYAVEFGVFHQLHCLNRIRQYTWRDWYFRHPDVVRTPSSMLDSDVGARMHTDHCIEALRISLMCHGDTTPLFSFEDPSAPLGMRADFSPQRKCRRFEDLHAWMSDRSNRDLAHDFQPERRPA